MARLGLGLGLGLGFGLGLGLGLGHLSVDAVEGVRYQVQRRRSSCRR